MTDAPADASRNGIPKEYCDGPRAPHTAGVVTETGHGRAVRCPWCHRYIVARYTGAEPDGATVLLPKRAAS